jgi:hypothetical protein
LEHEIAISSKIGGNTSKIHEQGLALQTEERLST